MKRGAFETGTYRNVFAEAGYDKETIEKRKNEIFHTLFTGQNQSGSIIPSGTIWHISRTRVTMMRGQKGCPTA